MNKTYNATKGSQNVWLNYFGWGDRTRIYNSARITGNFTGTTDEILQWTACKWGIDEDIVRAQAAKESWWQMTAKGDWTTDCLTLRSRARLGVDGQPVDSARKAVGSCRDRYPYRKIAWP